tara:strand:- start:7686 stop:7979 length:294 start_codon:yes stop_codon:yes gene_type:complete
VTHGALDSEELSFIKHYGDSFEPNNILYDLSSGDLINYREDLKKSELTIDNRRTIFIGSYSTNHFSNNNGSSKILGNDSDLWFLKIKETDGTLKPGP